MKIVKHSGAVVNFNPEKLTKSLLKSGADAFTAESIMKEITDGIYEGISTKNIYKKAFSLLKKHTNSNAARYNLRAAIEMLGPEGFYFEKYIARLFEAERYETKTNVILQGNCVMHEVDILIKKNNVISMVECKFHGGREAASDVKVPLYVFSRFNDLHANEYMLFSNKERIANCWIVTNTRFTADAIAFAECSGINLLSWDYPEKRSLKSRNNHDCLYPVTCLTTLTKAEKEKLLLLDVILVKELLGNGLDLKEIGISPNRIKNVLKEVSELCKCY
ncbi:restriction endonuclease [Flavobacterium undicola]|uniref:restriction endonuclease n=1 Tax=Flavobacterium undicola TaxID=1932779 RepID=UPI001376FA0C|nr:ATP cone domain-containing protein [Flavobacterium undicola]MBA0884463.1 restriction endonuclease [Flavobacterium undicola]